MAITFGLFFAVSMIRIDPDFGWHLRSGEYISQNSVPRVDIFSFTAEHFHWINHEWLNDWLVWHLHELGGPLLLVIIFAMLWATTLFLASRQKGLAMLVAAIALLPYAGVRPILWSVLFLAILLKIIHAKRSRLIYFLPPLFLLWANLHGSFAIGLAVLIYYALTQRRRRLAIVALMCALATFINPYGPQVYVEILRTAADGSLKWQIDEWHPLRALPALWLYLILIFAGFILYEKDKVKQAGSLPAIFFYAYIFSTRHFPLFVISSLQKLEGYWQQATRTLVNLNKSQRRLRAGIVLLTLLISTYGLVDNFVPWSFREQAYPSAAVPIMRQKCQNGNIFNHYNLGGFLIWKLPELKFYIDGRMPSWRDEQNKKYLDRYQLVFDRPEYRRQEFERYHITCTIVYNFQGEKSEFINSLRAEGWRTIWENDSYLLLKKR